MVLSRLVYYNLRMYDIFDNSCIRVAEIFMQYSGIEDYIFNGHWLTNRSWKFKYVIRNGHIMHYIFNAGLIGDD